MHEHLLKISLRWGYLMFQHVISLAVAALDMGPINVSSVLIAITWKKTHVKVQLLTPCYAISGLLFCRTTLLCNLVKELR